MRGFFNELRIYGVQNEHKFEERINPERPSKARESKGLLSNKNKRLVFRLIHRFICALLSLSLILSPSAIQAQTVIPTLLNLPIPGAMVPLSPAFEPVLLKGMTIHPENPLKFDFIIDSGTTNFSEDQIKEESERLVKYFLASMTVPKDDLWVNLSPYEKDRIIPDELGKTELGRDMLAQDYILKQLTASLMYPEEELGKKFWDRIYARAREEFGTSEIPVNTFNKVWILPDTATVYEHEQTVYIVDSRFKVMLDSDYVAMEAQQADTDTSRAPARGQAMQNANVGATGRSPLQDDSLESSEQIIREIILPEIEREVNEGKNFAPLRQIYHSLILAKWYKQTIKNSVGATGRSPLLAQVYIDQNKIAGVESGDEAVKEKIYAQYMEAYKKGVFNYIKEDYVAMDFQQKSTATSRAPARGDSTNYEIIPRKYFSGGLLIGAGEIDRTSSPVRDSENPQYREFVEVLPQKIEHEAYQEKRDTKYASRDTSDEEPSSSPVTDSDYNEMVVNKLIESLKALNVRLEDEIRLLVLGFDETNLERIKAVGEEIQSTIQRVLDDGEVDQAIRSVIGDVLISQSAAIFSFFIRNGLDKDNVSELRRRFDNYHKEFRGFERIVKSGELGNIEFYWIPSHFVKLDQLPLGIGKLSPTQKERVNRYIADTEAKTREIKVILDQILEKVSNKQVELFPITAEVKQLYDIGSAMGSIKDKILTDGSIADLDQLTSFISNEIKSKEYFTSLGEFRKGYLEAEGQRAAISRKAIEMFVKGLEETLKDDLEKGIEGLKRRMARVDALYSQLDRLTPRDKKVLDLLGPFEKRLEIVNERTPEGQFMLYYLEQLGAYDIIDEVVEAIEEGRVFAGPFEKPITRVGKYILISYSPDALLDMNVVMQLPVKERNDPYRDEKEAIEMVQAIASAVAMIDMQLDHMRLAIYPEDLQYVYDDIKNYLLVLTGLHDKYTQSGKLFTETQIQMVNDIFIDARDRMDLVLQEIPQYNPFMIPFLANLSKRLERRTEQFEKMLNLGYFQASKIEDIANTHPEDKARIMEISDTIMPEDQALLDALKGDIRHFPFAKRGDLNLLFILNHLENLGRRDIVLALKEWVELDKVQYGPFKKAMFRYGDVVFLAHNTDDADMDDLVSSPVSEREALKDKRDTKYVSRDTDNRGKPASSPIIRNILASMKSPAVTGFYISRLGYPSKRVRKNAIRMLGERRDPLAVKPLLRELKEGYFVDRLIKEIKDALISIGLPGVMIILDDLEGAGLDRLTDTLDPDIHKVLAEVVGKIGGRKVYDRLIEMLGTNDVTNIETAAWGLGYMEDERAIKILKEKLSQPQTDDREADLFIRVAVAEGLELLGDNSGEEYLKDREFRDHLKDIVGMNQDRKLEAIAKLGEKKDSRAVDPLLIQLLKQDKQRTFGPKAAINIAIMEALGEIGDERAISPLEKELDSGDWSQEAMTKMIEALRKLEAPQVKNAPRYLDLLESEFIQVQQHAIRWLGAMKYQPALEKLLGMLGDRSVAKDVVQAIISVGGKEAEQLKKLTQRMREKAPGVERESPETFYAHLEQYLLQVQRFEEEGFDFEVKFQKEEVRLKREVIPSITRGPDRYENVSETVKAEFSIVKGKPLEVSSLPVEPKKESSEFSPSRRKFLKKLLMYGGPGIFVIPGMIYLLKKDRPADITVEDVFGKKVFRGTDEWRGIDSFIRKVLAEDPVIQVHPRFKKAIEAFKMAAYNGLHKTQAGENSFAEPWIKDRIYQRSIVGIDYMLLRELLARAEQQPMYRKLAIGLLIKEGAKVLDHQQNPLYYVQTHRLAGSIKDPNFSDKEFMTVIARIIEGEAVGTRRLMDYLITAYNGNPREQFDDTVEKELQGKELANLEQYHAQSVVMIIQYAAYLRALENADRAQITGFSRKDQDLFLKTAIYGLTFSGAIGQELKSRLEKILDFESDENFQNKSKNPFALLEPSLVRRMTFLVDKKYVGRESQWSLPALSREGPASSPVKEKGRLKKNGQKTRLMEELEMIDQFVEDMEKQVSEAKDILNIIKRKIIGSQIPKISIKDDVTRLDDVRRNMVNLERNMRHQNIFGAFKKLDLVKILNVNPNELDEPMKTFMRDYLGPQAREKTIQSPLLSLWVIRVDDILTNDIEAGIKKIETFSHRAKSIQEEFEMVTAQDRQVIKQLGDFTHRLKAINRSSPEWHFILGYLTDHGAHDIANEVYEMLNRGQVFIGPFENLLFTLDGDIFISYSSQAKRKYENQSESKEGRKQALFEDEKKIDQILNELDEELTSISSRLFDLENNSEAVPNKEGKFSGIKASFNKIKEKEGQYFKREYLKSSTQQRMFLDIFDDMEKSVNDLKASPEYNRIINRFARIFVEKMEKRIAEFKLQIESGEFYIAKFDDQSEQQIFEGKTRDITDRIVPEDQKVLDVLRGRLRYLKRLQRNDPRVEKLLDHYLSLGRKEIAREILNKVKLGKVLSGPFTQEAFRFGQYILLADNPEMAKIADQSKHSTSDRSSSPVNIKNLEKWKDIPGVRILQGGKPGVDSDIAMIALTDENGNVIERIASKIDAHKKGLWHMTSHIYVFDRLGRMLLQQRSMKKKSSPGKLQVSVSGHVDAGENQEQAVLREGEEEIGIAIDPERLIRITYPNGIEREYKDKEGWNREFTTIYKYIVTDEELGQIEQNYNLNENDLFVLMPTDVFEQMIKNEEELFSNSLRRLVTEHPEIYRQIKETEQVASSPVEEREASFVKRETQDLSEQQADASRNTRYASQDADDVPGGIDMNNIEVDRQGGGVRIEFDPVEIQQIIDMGVDGFTPVIINLVPLPSVLPLLGLAPRKEEEFEISRK